MRLFRLIAILTMLARNRLDRLLPDDIYVPFAYRPVLWLLRLVPPPAANPAVSLRTTIEQLGPIFIKFGQILSTRRDLFSEEIAAELQKLQDQVPPFDSMLARQILEHSQGAPVDAIFDEFEDLPLASASVAQVHSARLKTGESVVVKIIRPGIRALIQRDLLVMYLLAEWLEKVWADGRRLHPVAVVRDYEHTILNELDMHLEAANATTLRNHWQLSGKLYVPRVYWDYTRTDVMVMERIHGVRATDLDTLRAHKVNLHRLSHLGVEIFFTQVFEHNFFHADMHPGNVFIDVTDPEQPTYIALDCAIIGSLTEGDKTYLAKNLLAFFHRDYTEVARLHVESGWVPADTDIREFETVIRRVCEPIFQKPIKDISFGKLLVSLFQTAQRFNMEVQPQLVLLQKTLLNIEGMGRQIDPDLNLWDTAAPFMEKWMAERIGIGARIRQLGKQLPHLPQLATDAIAEIRQLGRNNRSQLQLLGQLRDELQNQRRARHNGRLGGIALLAALLTAVVPLSGYAASSEIIIGSSLLGGIGLYWMFIRP